MYISIVPSADDEIFIIIKDLLVAINANGLLVAHETKTAATATRKPLNRTLKDLDVYVTVTISGKLDQNAINYAKWHVE